MSRNSALTFDELWRAVREVEDEFDLLDFKVGSIYVWPVMRDAFVRDLAETLGIFEKRPPEPNVADLYGERSIVAAYRKAQVGVVPFVRRTEDGTDPHTDFIVDALREGGVEPLVFGMGSADLDSGRPQVEVLERNFLRKYRTWAKFMVGLRLRRRHKLVFDEVLEALAEKLVGEPEANIAEKFTTLPRWLLVDFYAKRMGFRRFFKLTGIKTLVVANAWKRSLIAGAQQAGVWVIETQHGLLSSKSPLLSWSNADYVDYLPNELFLWGKRWHQILGAPESLTKTVIGAPRSMTQIPEVVARKPKTVLIISQVQQTRKILELAVRAALANPDYKFVLKPHPQEQQLTLGDLATVSPQIPANLQFASATAKALPMIIRAEYVLGVHSMGLIEALATGAKVLVLRLPGYERIVDLANPVDLTLVRADSDLVLELAEAKVPSQGKEFFEEPISSEKLFAAIMGEEVE